MQGYENLKQKPTSFSFPNILSSKNLSEQQLKKVKRIHLLDHHETLQINLSNQQLDQFKSNDNLEIQQNGVLTHYFRIEQSNQISFKSKYDYLISISKSLSQKNLLGYLSDIFSSTYQFTLKTLEPKRKQPTLYYDQSIQNIQKIIQLAKCKSYAKELANQRGNVGNPQFFLNECKNIAFENNLQIIFYKDKQILENGFTLLDAVGRASINKPIFVNLLYKGAPNSNKYIAYVGKGLCFDAGGLNLKIGNNLLNMHMDKHGACSVMSAIRTIAKLKLKVNITASFGFAENFINQNSYRTNDIIQSRKGLTVQIGNTDAQGRLTLADVMNWTQQKYKPTHLIQLSTLTYDVILALGLNMCGIWSNDKQLIRELKQAGQQSNQQLWHLPLTKQHRKLTKSKYADLNNCGQKSEGGAAQGAAFLQAFVQKQTQWAHLDIAAAILTDGQATGYGARLLVNFAQRSEKLFL